MDINDSKKQEKTKTKISKTVKNLKIVVRLIEKALGLSLKVLKGRKSKTTNTPVPAREVSFVASSASTNPTRSRAITNMERENKESTFSAINKAIEGTSNAVDTLKSIVDQPVNVVNILQDLAKCAPTPSTQTPAESTATTKPVDSTVTATPVVPGPDAAEAKTSSSRPTITTSEQIMTRSLTNPSLEIVSHNFNPSIADVQALVSGTATTTTTSTPPAPPFGNTSNMALSSISGVAVDVNTSKVTDGKKKKKPRKQKTSNLNPSRLIEQAVEYSPKAIEVVKRGMNSVNGSSGATSSVNAISNSMTSTVNGASKFTDTLTLKRKDFDTIIPVGPVAFVLKGHIERTNLEIDASFNVKVGFITHKLGKVVGNLKTGVRVKFGLSGVLTGQARFYMPLKKVKGKKAGKGTVKGDTDKEGEDETKNGERSKWLWLDIKVTVFKEDIRPLSLPLIPLRFGHAKSNSDALSISSRTEQMMVEVTWSVTKRSIEVSQRSINISRQAIELDAYCSTVARHSIEEIFSSFGAAERVLVRPETPSCSALVDSWRCQEFSVGYHS